MTQRTLTLARPGDENAFRELTDPHRHELQLHCYRIVGSTQDAEGPGPGDTAGRLARTGPVHRAGLDPDLAVPNCHQPITRRAARERAPTTAPRTLERPAHTPTRITEPIWLEPYPDALIDAIADDTPGPEARYEHSEATALAFVAGLQYLSPQQRAVLVLRGVLGFRAAEVAAILDTG